MPGDLYDRLKRIKQARRATPASHGTPSESPRCPGTPSDAGAQSPAVSARSSEPAAPTELAGSAGRTTPTRDGLSDGVAGLEGWARVAPLVYARETVVQIGAAVGSRPFESRLLARRIDPGSLRFIDTETTGLSGGAGTTVFLVGAGTIEGDSVRVRQALLVDFPGEPDFLDAVGRDLAGEVWVSYNGKAFDSRLLESRFVMNGIPPMEVEQLDLLYWARRLWRSRLESCTLSEIERSVLDRGRVDDIPGFEIPERYFRFLRDRDGAHLGEVFEHHRLDIVSLVHLFLRIERVLADPIAERLVDCYQLARWIARSDQETAAALFERAVDESDAEIAARAAISLSRIYRRRRRSDEALRALARVPDPLAGPVVTEMAKILEHDRRDAAAALNLVESYLEREPTAAGAAEIVHRLERLRRKSAREG